MIKKVAILATLVMLTSVLSGCGYLPTAILNSMLDGALVTDNKESVIESGVTDDVLIVFAR